MAGRQPTTGGRERTEARGPACPLCGASLYRRHCRYVCPQHGTVIDCSDPFL